MTDCKSLHRQRYHDVADGDFYTIQLAMALEDLRNQPVMGDSFEDSPIQLMAGISKNIGQSFVDSGILSMLTKESE